MKTILKICVLTLSGVLAMAGCRGKECLSYGYSTKIVSLRAELYENGVAVNHSDPIKSSDLRLKIFCEIGVNSEYTFTSDNGCGSYGNTGLYPRLGEMAVACGSDLAGIVTETNLLTEINPHILWGGIYEWTIDEWRNTLNAGRTSDYYDYVTIDPGITYEFEIAFLPYYVTVAEGSYTFTFSLRTGYGENDVYVRTFNPVALY